MLLAYFNIHVTEAELIKSLGTVMREGVGTDHEVIADELTARGLHCVQQHGANLNDISNAIRERLPVLVNYTNPVDGRGHFSLVIGISDRHVILHDPKNGKGYTLLHNTFEQHWMNGTRTLERWMLIAARERAQLPTLAYAIA
jgi:ABC-type bacteriocin/lantibiotic exporter with double-glycine peptidase domain